MSGRKIRPIQGIFSSVSKDPFRSILRRNRFSRLYFCMFVSLYVCSFINLHRCYRFEYFAVSKKCIPKYTEVIKRTLLFTNTPFSSSKTIILFFFLSLVKKNLVFPFLNKFHVRKKIFFYPATAFRPPHPSPHSLDQNTANIK